LTTPLTAKLTRPLTGAELEELFLEKFKFTLGSELITNGDFDDTSAWTTNGDATINTSTNSATIDGTSQTSYIVQDVLTEGKTYVLTFDVSSDNGTGNRWITNNLGGGGLYYSITGNGSQYVTFTHSNSSGNLFFTARNGGSFIVSNVSVKEVIKQAPVAAFSLRKLGNVSQYAARIRRSSDNTEAQVMFDASNRVSESSVVRNTSQNLIPFSEDFSNSAWTKINSAVTTSTITDPFGGTNAYKYSETSTANNNKLLIDTFAVSSGKSYSFSIYAKKGELDVMQLILGSVTYAGGNNHANFNLTSGTVTATGGGCVAKIEEVGTEGWYRCSISDVTSASGNTEAVIGLYNSPTAGRASTYSGNGTDGIYIFGGQGEETVTYESTGTEKITNGTFDTDSDWTKTSGVTISGGKLNMSVVGGAYTKAAQLLTYKAGASYKVTFTVNGTSGKVIRVRDDAGNNGGLTASTGTVTLDGTDQVITKTFIATSGSDEICFERDTGVGDYSFTIDNVSLLEFDPIPSEYISTPVVSNDGLTFVESTLDDFVGGENLFTHSEFTSGWAWHANLNPAPTLNAGTDPLGGNTAVKIVNDSGNELKLLRPSTTPTATASNTYTASLYVKDAGARYLVFFLNDTASRKLNVDLQTGQIDSFNGNGGSGIENVGNGWFRVHFSHTMTTTMSSISIVPSNSNYDVSLAGNGTDGLLIWGAQFNTGATLKKYQKTSGTARDGNAGIVVLYNQTGGEDAIQSNTSHQPLLYNAGLLVRSGSSPAIEFVAGSPQRNLVFQGLTGIDPLDAFFVQEANDNQYIYPSSNNGTYYGWVALDDSSGVDVVRGVYGSPILEVNGSAVSLSTEHDVHTALNGRKLVYHRSARTTSWPEVNIGNTFGTTHAWNLEDFKFSEIIFFDSDQHSNQAAIEKHLNDFHNIF